MRTTVTLNDEIANELERLAFETKQSFKAVINQTLERGLAAGNTVSLKPMLLPPRLGKPRVGVNFEKALALSAELEDQECLLKLQREV